MHTLQMISQAKRNIEECIGKDVKLIVYNNKLLIESEYSIPIDSIERITKELNMKKGTISPHGNGVRIVYFLGD